MSIFTYRLCSLCLLIEIATEYLFMWRLQVLEADVSTEGGAKQLAEVISSQYGTVDYAVSAFGGWWQNGVILPLCLRRWLNLHLGGRRGFLERTRSIVC